MLVDTWMTGKPFWVSQDEKAFVKSKSSGPSAELLIVVSNASNKSSDVTGSCSLENNFKWGRLDNSGNGRIRIELCNSYLSFKYRLNESRKMFSPTAFWNILITLPAGIEINLKSCGFRSISRTHICHKQFGRKVHRSRKVFQRGTTSRGSTPMRQTSMHSAPFAR